MNTLRIVIAWVEWKTFQTMPVSNGIILVDIAIKKIIKDKGNLFCDLNSTI